MTGTSEVYPGGPPLMPGQYVLRKLPHITALFWALKNPGHHARRDGW